MHVNVCAPFAVPCACQGVRISGRRVARGARAARFQNLRGRPKIETAPRATRAPYHGCRQGAMSFLVWAPVGSSAKAAAAASGIERARMRGLRLPMCLLSSPRRRTTRSRAGRMPRVSKTCATASRFKPLRAPPPPAFYHGSKAPRRRVWPIARDLFLSRWQAARTRPNARTA